MSCLGSTSARSTQPLESPYPDMACILVGACHNADYQVIFAVLNPVDRYDMDRPPINILNGMESPRLALPGSRLREHNCRLCTEAFVNDSAGHP